MACKENDTETIEKLLKAGQTPNCSYNGESALATAIKEKNIEAIEMLVKYKVDLRPDDEISPLQFAVQELAAEKDFNVLFPIVKLFVENGADVNATTGFSTVFSNVINMVANLELVKYLHEHGAVIKDGNHNSRNPEINKYLKEAFEKQDPAKIKQLEEQRKKEAEEKRKRDDIIWGF
jgi:ankyrin repeat protein